MESPTSARQAEPYTDARLTEDMTGLAKQLEARATRQPAFVDDVDLATAGRRLLAALTAVVGES